VEKEGTTMLNPPSCKLKRATILARLTFVLVLFVVVSLAMPSRVQADAGGFPTTTPTATAHVSVQESDQGATSPKQTAYPVQPESKPANVQSAKQPQIDGQTSPTPTPTANGGGILTNVYCMVISIVVLAAAVFIYIFLRRSKK
jgi:hypothetical protein